MCCSLNGLIRGLIYLTVVTTLTAIGVNRLAPKPSHFRILKQVNVVPINSHHFRKFDRLPRFLDPATGQLSLPSVVGDDSFDIATCSPWEDDQGQTLVVGRWLGRSTADGLCEGCGLARYRFPGGKSLERVRLDVLPVSRPCIDPDRPASVVFAAGDGRLYRYSFEKGEENTDSDVHKSTLVRWNTASAGEMPVAICDPVWPTDPRFKGRLIAGFTRFVCDQTGKRVLRTRLGWFQLDREGTEIVRAGHLVESENEAAAELILEASLPVVSSGPELKLAYLTHETGETGWTLQVGPLEFDEAGIPSLDRAGVRPVVTSRSHSLPVFSADGHSLYSMVLSEPKPETLECHPATGRDHPPTESLARHPLESGLLSTN